MIKYDEEAGILVIDDCSRGIHIFDADEYEALMTKLHKAESRCDFFEQKRQQNNCLIDEYADLMTKYNSLYHHMINSNILYCVQVLKEINLDVVNQSLVDRVKKAIENVCTDLEFIHDDVKSLLQN